MTTWREARDQKARREDREARYYGPHNLGKPCPECKQRVPLALNDDGTTHHPHLRTRRPPPPQENPMTTITEPGVYLDLPPEDYHSQHDWLSWSRMKHLIPPSTPAHFKASLKAGEKRKRHYELGQIVHKLVLDDPNGPTFEVVQALNRQKEPYDAADYNTKSAQEHRDAILERGNIPILQHELTGARAMATAVANHPVAGSLLCDGEPEVSLFWIDDTTGVKCRARLDWLPATDGGRMIVPDVKTAASAAPREFAKAAAKHGYYGQQQHYSDGIKALGLCDDPEFVFIVIEKEDPYLPIVGRFDCDDDLRLARAVVEHCRRLYSECTAADTWPGYPGGITDLTLPTWLFYDLGEHIPGLDAEMVI